MLSRTAENLYWMARYVERADCTARLIEMGQRMAMLPGGAAQDEWRSVVQSSGFPVEPDLRVTEADAVNMLMLSEENPSSIRGCLTSARSNARAVRTALTQAMWEALNDGWRRLDGMEERELRRDLPGLLDWVTQRCATFRGVSEIGMLRRDPYDFMNIGGLVERADMTLRLLDVKYFVLLPETEVAGGGRDFHQWTSVLHATSARRAYHHVYRGDYSPWSIADFLILNREFPRSLAYCYWEIGQHLDQLALRYGKRHECQSLAHTMIARLEDADMNEIFQDGLHEFITEAIRVNANLAAAISRAYHF